MGYFANGTEGDFYYDKYCIRCVHMLEDHSCPCSDTHLLWDYDECNNKDSILHKMIPIDKHSGNQQCIFFKTKRKEAKC